MNKTEINKSKRCGVCFRYIQPLQNLCSDCEVKWKYTIKIIWIDYHHGNHLLTITYSYIENGDWWFNDKVNIQLNNQAQTTKEAYLTLVNNPSLLKTKVMVDVDSTLLRVKFPRFPKHVGVDMYEDRI